MSDPVTELNQQLRSGWGWLAFAGTLERGFREHYEAQQIPSRLVLISLGLLLIGTTPLVDTLFMHPPPDFADLTHAMQFAVMIPATLLALAVTAVPRLRRLSPAVGVLAILVIAGGVIVQRHLGARYGYYVPSELATLVIAGGFVLGGLRFWPTLPVALAILAAMAANELLTYGNTSASAYTIHVNVMQALIVGAAGYLQEYLARGNWLRNRLLEELSIRDPLTGLLNSRAFHERYQALSNMARRERRPVLVAVLDVDCFKEFNDCYGHAAGDQCLTHVAEAIGDIAQRSDDIKARIGGEEFVVVCYDIPQETASGLVHGMRQQIEALQIPHTRSRVPCQVVTVSVGAVWFKPEDEAGAEAALNLADVGLYEAKRAGRNCVKFIDYGATRASNSAPQPA